MPHFHSQEEAKNYARSLLPDYLSSEKSISFTPGNYSRKKFNCLNPEHADHSPSMSIVDDNNPIKCHCFACGITYDIFDLISIDTGYKDAELFKYTYDKYNITYDNDKQSRPKAPVQNTPAAQPESAHAAKPTRNFSELYAHAHKDVSKAADYLKSRGFSGATANKYNLGYIEDYKGIGRVVIPYSDSFFTARSITGAEPKYLIERGVNKELFNVAALQTADKPIFITEGAFDAISIMECGHPAIALDGVPGALNLISAVNANKPSQPLILMLDDDAAGRCAQKELEHDLSSIGIDYVSRFIKGAHDANELLVSNKAALIKQLNEYSTYAQLPEKERLAQDYMKSNSAAYSVDAFLDNVKASCNQPIITTGFDSVDGILDGGFHPGLYILGAVSSAGKTTLLLQMADNIAKSGTDVLVFSLEMSRNELIAKSLSRLTMQEDVRSNSCISYAKTTREMMTGRYWASFDKASQSLINYAVNEYKDFAKHLYICAEFGNIDMQTIRAKVQEHIERTGKKPVVIIDYLQIIEPDANMIRCTDKQITDKAVKDLKHISVDYNLPIVAISSFNRESYYSPVTLTSFKESGAIEYSSDVLLGLQFKGMEDVTGSEKDVKNRTKALIDAQIENGRNGRAQEMQLKILKNRNGGRGQLVDLRFYPKWNCFEESK